MNTPWLIVLAGGSGTRFWPRSRAKRPKQFLPLAGDEPLLVTTIHRFQSWIPQERVIIVTTKDLENETIQVLGQGSKVKVIAEPLAKNTAPAIALGMEWLRKRDPKALAVVVPADHWISETKEYLDVMKQAADACVKHQSLCTIGIEPTRAETGYGYIRAGEAITSSVRKVERFVEKPSREVAETMVQSQEYFWNSGMFAWTVDCFFQEMKLHCPEIIEAFGVLKDSEWQGSEPMVVEAYKNAPSISIDYALLEKSKKVNMVPGSDFGWNDLGSFLSLGDVYPKVEGGVGRAKEILALDSMANIIDTPGKTVALLGVHDLILVDTGDVILLASKERAQDVKMLVERLKRGDRKDLL